MPAPALILSKQLVKYLAKYGPTIISNMPQVWPEIREFLTKIFSGDRDVMQKELTTAQQLLNDTQQQLSASVQALELAVHQRRMYQVLAWVLGGIALFCFAVAMWALGRIS